MGANVVERMNKDFVALVAYLDSAGEISLRSTVDDNFRKSLLLCVASYFEKLLTENVADFVEEMSQKNLCTVHFVRNKAINRQYHTWFDWNAKNANAFFGLFGDEFKKYMINRVRCERRLEESIQAFLELGSDRNRLVHQDFGSFTLEKTTSDIYSLYEKAAIFIEAVPEALRDFSTNGPRNI